MTAALGRSVRCGAGGAPDIQAGGSDEACAKVLNKWASLYTDSVPRAASRLMHLRISWVLQDERLAGIIAQCLGGCWSHISFVVELSWVFCDF